MFRIRGSGLGWGVLGFGSWVRVWEGFLAFLLVEYPGALQVNFSDPGVSYIPGF